MKNYYDILGLESSCDLDDIKSAYRKLSKKFHPDLNPNDKFFEKMFKDINEANAVLSNSNSKQKYDKILELFQNRYNNVNKTLEEIEIQIKKEFEDILKQREEEIKKKFWTQEQFRKEAEQKNEEKRRIFIENIKAKYKELEAEQAEIEKNNIQYRSKLEQGNKRSRAITKKMKVLKSNYLSK